MKKLLVKNTAIIDSSGKEVYLRGVNLGGWLLMEGYILGGRNIPERSFTKQLRTRYGSKDAITFVQKFRRSFITKKDIFRIKAAGLNCVRIPFHYQIVPKDFTFLDQAISWCTEAQVYAILDMHAAPGSQNADWHGDSLGKALFWEDIKYRAAAAALWKKIARRYAGSSVVAGYDILNEPVTDRTNLINQYYNRVVQTIRSAGDSHIIFLEGNMWAQEMDFLRIKDTRNVAYSVHCYQPLDHSFNFHPGQTYPGKIDSAHWNKKRLHHLLQRYIRFQKKVNAPIFVGEFGINARCYHCHNELKLTRDLLSLFNQYNWHWTYWTYKAVGGGLFPNGIYQFLENPKWINRQGPVIGWETYTQLSKPALHAIPNLLKTEQFVKHASLMRVLSMYA
ncbi:MAG: glycoside hydrolase family 5 protein [bacterium]